MTEPYDDRLRALITEAVEDVEPRHGLEAIAARTPERRARLGRLGRGRWAGAATVLASAAAVAAVVVLVGLPHGRGGLGPGPDPSPDESEQALAPAPPTVPRYPWVYYVGDTGAGERLFRERVTEPLGDQGARRLGLRAVAAGLSGTPADPDYRAAWPAGTVVEAVSVDGGGDVAQVTVSLSRREAYRAGLADRPAGWSPDQSLLALQQLVLTMRDLVGRDLEVTLLIDGEPADRVLGVPVDGPLVPASADDVLSPVSVEQPVQDATVGSPFVVTGDASAVEANVQWELMRGDEVVQRGATTARECCTLSPYSFEVTAEPGDYTLVVHDEDASDGEGNGATRDTKRITVR